MTPTLIFQNKALLETLKENITSRTDDATVLGELENNYITVKEVRTLLNPNWLSDDIINAYMTILGREFKPRVFVLPSYWSAQMSNKGFQGVESWSATKQLKEILNFTNSGLVLIPVNIFELHWVLCCLDPKLRVWSILDSAGDLQSVQKSKFFSEMELWILFCAHGGNEEEGKKWTFEFPINSKNKHQNFRTDTYNCGVYLCYYARELTIGVSIVDVSTKDIPTKEIITSFRDDMLLSLVEGIPLILM